MFSGDQAVILEEPCLLEEVPETLVTRRMIYNQKRIVSNCNALFAHAVKHVRIFAPRRGKLRIEHADSRKYLFIESNVTGDDCAVGDHRMNKRAARQRAMYRPVKTPLDTLSKTLLDATHPVG